MRLVSWFWPEQKLWRRYGPTVRRKIRLESLSQTSQAPVCLWSYACRHLYSEHASIMALAVLVSSSVRRRRTIPQLDLLAGNSNDVVGTRMFCDENKLRIMQLDGLVGLSSSHAAGRSGAGVLKPADLQSRRSWIFKRHPVAPSLVAKASHQSCLLPMHLQLPGHQQCYRKQTLGAQR